MMGRFHVTAEDITALTLPVMRHRVLANYYAESDGVTVDDVLTQLVESMAGAERKAQAG
jgi:MoxR-like ATPase